MFTLIPNQTDERSRNSEDGSHENQEAKKLSTLSAGKKTQIFRDLGTKRLTWLK